MIKKCQMPRQTMPKRIRRCMGCGQKTHGSYWEGPVCPLCHSVEGFTLTAHGGLSKEEIQIKIRAIEQIEGGTPGKERF